MSTRSIHPFPARMAPEIALSAITALGTDPVTVLDPMCGSGTVLTTATARGHHAVGVDIDPLAVMMSRFAATPPSPELLEAALSRALSRQSRPAIAPPWGDDVETDVFASYWFGPNQRRHLTHLAAVISQEEDFALRLSLQLAMSRIIITKTPQASLAADTAHSRPHKVLTDSDFDVIAGFKQSVMRLIRFAREAPRVGAATVLLGDARALTAIDNESIDLVVTSPPYLNALDYLRGHKMALIWFGYTISELRKRRSASIGSERSHDGDIDSTASEIVGLIEASASNPSTLRRGMIERFAHDCISFATELNRVLKGGTTAVLVVGNSTLRGNYIENDLIAQRSMESVGFRLTSRYEREIPPNRRYMAINSLTEPTAITRRMRHEVVLSMEKK